MIPVFSNTFGDEETAAFARVSQTRWLGAGPEVAAFEAEWLAHLGSTTGGGHVLLCNNCTAALYLALKALGVEQGDEVILPAVHFVGAANAAILAGARPVFCDVDPRTLNVSLPDMRKRATRWTRAVLLLHYGGHPCDMDAVRAALPKGAQFVEDAANGPASTYRGQAIGTFGFAGVWSFDAMKHISMGDGGALWLRWQIDAEKARQLRYLGLVERSGSDTAKERDRWWEYQVSQPSLRFISNDLAAAVGRAQLPKLAGFVARRREVWQAYQAGLAGVDGLTLPPEPLEGCASSYYLYWVQTARRDELAKYLYANGVYTTFRYWPLHLVRRFSYTYRLPGAEAAAATTLNLPLHQNLSDGDVTRIIELVREFFK